MKMFHLNSTPGARLAGALLASFGLVLPLSAATTPDLGFSSFAATDLETLSNGQVQQARGGLIPFQRGLTAQSVYLIDATPALVAQKLLTWNPAAHPELTVYEHGILPAKPVAADFGFLAQLPGNPSVKAAIKATVNLNPAKPELQLSPAEAQLLAGAKAQGGSDQAIFANFWSQLLAGRCQQFLSGNPVCLPQTIDGAISPYTEIKSLLRSDLPVFRRFSSLLLATPPFKGTKAIPATNYSDAFDIEGETALGVGSVFQEPSGPAILSADLEYYVSSGIYVSVELEALFPEVVAGKNQTLVWRQDLVSTENVAYLHGTERLASGMIMLQDVRQAVDAFRSEFK